MQRERLTDEELAILAPFEGEMNLALKGSQAYVHRNSFGRLLDICNRVYHTNEKCDVCAATRIWVLKRLAIAYNEDKTSTPSTKTKKRARKGV